MRLVFNDKSLIMSIIHNNTQDKLIRKNGGEIEICSTENLDKCDANFILMLIYYTYKCVQTKLFSGTEFLLLSLLLMMCAIIVITSSFRMMWSGGIFAQQVNIWGAVDYNR